MIGKLADYPHKSMIASKINKSRTGENIKKLKISKYSLSIYFNTLTKDEQEKVQWGWLKCFN